MNILDYSSPINPNSVAVSDLARNVEGYDEADPKMYYGTNEYGAIGFYDLPKGNGNGTAHIEQKVYYNVNANKEINLEGVSSRENSKVMLQFYKAQEGRMNVNELITSYKKPNELNLLYNYKDFELKDTGIYLNSKNAKYQVIPIIDEKGYYFYNINKNDYSYITNITFGHKYKVDPLKKKIKTKTKEIEYTDIIYLDSFSGDDENPGTVENPIKTFNKCAQLINNLPINSNVAVILASGEYELVNESPMFQTPLTNGKIMIFGNYNSIITVRDQWANRGGGTQVLLEFYFIRWQHPESSSANKMGVYGLGFYGCILEPKDDGYSYFNQVILILDGCTILNTYSSNGLKVRTTTSRTGTSITNCIGNIHNGYDTSQGTWDKGGNKIITDMMIDNDFKPLKEEYYGYGIDHDNYRKYSTKGFLYKDKTAYTIYEDELTKFPNLIDQESIDMWGTNLDLLCDYYDEFTLITMEDADIFINGIKPNVSLVADIQDYLLKDFSHINKIQLNSVLNYKDNEIKIVFSIDGGISWYTYLGDSFKKLDIQIPSVTFYNLTQEEKELYNMAKQTISEQGVSSTIFNNLDFNKVPNMNKIRFAYTFSAKHTNHKMYITDIYYNYNTDETLTKMTEEEIKVDVYDTMFVLTPKIQMPKMVVNILGAEPEETEQNFSLTNSYNNMFFNVKANQTYTFVNRYKYDALIQTYFADIEDINEVTVPFTSINADPANVILEEDGFRIKNTSTIEVMDKQTEVIRQSSYAKFEILFPTIDVKVERKGKLLTDNSLVTSNSEYNKTTMSAYRAFDGRTDTSWCTKYSDNVETVKPYVIYDFEEDTDIISLSLTLYDFGKKHPTSISFYGSNDGIEYTYYGYIHPNTEVVTKIFNETKTIRYMKIVINSTVSPNYTGIKEIAFYGPQETRFLIKSGENTYSLNEDNNLYQTTDFKQGLTQKQINENMQYLPNAFQIVGNVNFTCDLKVLKVASQLVISKVNIETDRKVYIGWHYNNPDSIVKCLFSTNGENWYTFTGEEIKEVNIDIPKSEFIDMNEGEIYRWNKAKTIISNYGLDISQRLPIFLGDIDSSELLFAYSITPINESSDCQIKDIYWNIYEEYEYKKLCDNDVDIDIKENLISITPKKDYDVLKISVLLGKGTDYSTSKDLINTNEIIREDMIGDIVSIRQEPFSNYLECNGEEYNISEYKDLANTISDIYGSVNYFGGDGITTFAVPQYNQDFIWWSPELNKNNYSSSGIIVTADQEQDVNTGPAWKAFTHTVNYNWSGDVYAGSWRANSAFPHWLQIEFPYYLTIDAFTIAPRADDSLVDKESPYNFEFYGSNDGENYELLGEYKNTRYTNFEDIKHFFLDGEVTYKIYKWIFLDNNYKHYGSTSNYIYVEDITFRRPIKDKRYIKAYGTIDNQYSSNIIFNGEGTPDGTYSLNRSYRYFDSIAIINETWDYEDISPDMEFDNNPYPYKVKASGCHTYWYHKPWRCMCSKPQYIQGEWGWHHGVSPLNHWWQFDFGEPTMVEALSISKVNNTDNRVPSGIDIYGSNDDYNFTLITQIRGKTYVDKKPTFFDFGCSPKYRIYRFVIKEMFQNSRNIYIGRIRFYTRKKSIISNSVILPNAFQLKGVYSNGFHLMLDENHFKILSDSCNVTKIIGYNYGNNIVKNKEYDIMPIEKADEIISDIIGGNTIWQK